MNHTVIIVEAGYSDDEKYLAAHNVDRFKNMYKYETNRYSDWTLQTLYDAGYTIYGYEIDADF